MRKLVVFPKNEEYEKAKNKLIELKLEYKTVTPGEEYRTLAAPALVLREEDFFIMMKERDNKFYSSGWIDYREPLNSEIKSAAKISGEDYFGRASVMFFGPCYADDTRLRLIAYLTHDISDVFPYINSYMRAADYNPEEKMLGFMDQYRLINMYSNKIAIAKADDITDAWRTLGSVRDIVNFAHANRESIKPSYERRRKPSAMDIYARLPKTNCGQCGQKTCLAFALSLLSGAAQPFMCKPVFEEKYSHLSESYTEICAGLGTVVRLD